MQIAEIPTHKNKIIVKSTTIDNVLKDYGYSSRPEFIKEAIRDKLKDLGRLVEK